MMYGFIYEGTYKAEDFNADGSLRDGIPAYKGNTMQPGDLKYRDMNGDGKIDDYDRTIIGCGQPLHTGGFATTFNWKNFDLNIFFSWSYGNDILNANRLVFEAGWKSQTNQLASFANRWTPENASSNMPRKRHRQRRVFVTRHRGRLVPASEERLAGLHDSEPPASARPESVRCASTSRPTTSGR